MFCFKCGTQSDDNQLFCASCGAQLKVTDDNVSVKPEFQPSQTPYTAPVTQMQAEPQNDTLAYTQFSPPKKASKRLGLKIGLPVGALVLIVAGFLAFGFLRGSGDTVTRSLAGLGQEIGQRLDDTPLSVFSALSDIMEDGTLSFELDYTDYWGDKTSADVKLSSKTEAKEYALVGNITSDEINEKINFEVYANKERAAIGSSNFDSNYYGVKYSTFRNDIKTFGRLFDLDDDDMDEIADFVEVLETLISSDGFNSGKYADVLIEAYKNLERTSEKTKIYVGGSEINVTKTDLVITKEIISELLDSIYETMVDDENARSLYNVLEIYTYQSYNDYLAEYRSSIREFNRTVDDNTKITLSFYTGSGDRLMKLEIDADIRVDGERERIKISADFGASATDTWKIDITAFGEKIKITWTHKERGNSVESAITVGNEYEDFEFISDWNKSTGDFTLSFGDGYDTVDFDGVFLKSDKGFELEFKFTNSSWYYDDDEVYKIKISASRGADIKQVSYINIDKWDQDLIDKLEDFFWYIY